MLPSTQNANNLQPHLGFCMKEIGFLSLLIAKHLRFMPAVFFMGGAYTWPLLVGSIALHVGSGIGLLLLSSLVMFLAVCGAADLYTRLFISSSGLIETMIDKKGRVTDIRGHLFGRPRGEGLQDGVVKVPRAVNSARLGSMLNKEQGFIDSLITGPAYHTTPPNPIPFQ